MSTSSTRKVLVIGGSGFLGRSIAKSLLTHPGLQVQLASRHPKGPNTTYSVLHAADAQLPEPATVDIQNENSIQQACNNADVVINLVGIMHESRNNQFDSVQHVGAGRVARAAHAAGAQLVHISAIGADPTSIVPYAQSKGLGEQAVRAAHPDATILRPSIVFGPEDDFFNRFVRLARYMPIMPYLPVYVEDVARAVHTCVDRGTKCSTLTEQIKTGLRNNGELDVRGKIIELGGPTSAIMERLPINLFTITRDQVRLLQIDNKVDDAALGLMDLGIQPTSLESILPAYLSPKTKT
ncbi:hypothetical protein BDF19DRAFT_471631 [Syncephalis fuscata]|nr:hypothetical protein BDF19DRAFT_471631 [Syncephalis fuscata]